MSRKFFYMLGAMTVIGCASTPSRPDGSTPLRKGNELSAEEVAGAHADVNSIYDAIARLRPNWLAPRGMMSGQSTSNYPQVFVDDQLVGDIGSLRNINAYQVGVAKYYDVSQAGARFGLRAGTNGAIEIVMKRAGNP